MQIWTVEDYYRAKRLYEENGAIFNPALVKGSPAELHVRTQEQLRRAMQSPTPPAGTATPPGPQDWRDLAETCRELAKRLDATAGEPLEREPLAPLLGELAANSRRVELDAPPLSWTGFYWDDGADSFETLDCRYPNGPATQKTLWTFDAADEPPGTARRQHGDHEQTRREAVAVLQSWVRHAERKAAELTTPQAAPSTPPAANLGRQFFNVASWLLYPFGDRPQRLPTDKPRGVVTFNAAAAPYMIPPYIPPVIEGSPTPGGTGRLERGGVAVELYFPTDAERATLAAALPGCDLDAPPWHAVQARLLSAGLSADWQHLTAPAAVALLARTSTAPPPGHRQSEGAGAGSEGGTPPAPGDATPTGDETNRDKFDKLPKARRLAYFAFQYAAEKSGTHPTRFLDRDAWDWLNENGIDEPDEIAGELANYRPPESFSTWVKYLGDARTALGEQKHRRGTPAPTGHSVARRDEL